MNNLPDFPSTWESKSLGAVADVIDPHPSHRAPEEDRTGIPFAGIGDIKENGELILSKVRLVSESIFEQHAQRYRLNGNAIGFGRVASIGKIVNFRNYKSKITISPTMAIVNPTGIEKLFLMQCLRSEFTQSQIQFLLTGSTRSSLGIELLRGLLIPFPDKTERHVIASILTSVDEVIDKTESQISKLQDLKKGMMQELLTKGIGHTEFKDSPVGRIPKSWGVIQLHEVSSHITKGATPTTYGFEWEQNGVLFLRSECVKKGNFSLEGSMHISQRAHDAMGRSKVSGGDILISITGYIGNACIFPEYLKEANINQHIARVSIKDEILKRFVVQYLNTENQYRRYLNIQTGQAYPQLSLKQVQDTFIPKPDREEMAKIVLALESVDEKIQVKVKENAAHNYMKKALMHDLLTGKVRVKVN